MKLTVRWPTHDVGDVAVVTAVEHPGTPQERVVPFDLFDPQYFEIIPGTGGTAATCTATRPSMSAPTVVVEDGDVAAQMRTYRGKVS